MKVKYVSMFAVIVLVVLSGMPALSGGNITPKNYAYACWPNVMSIPCIITGTKDLT